MARPGSNRRAFLLDNWLRLSPEMMLAEVVSYNAVELAYSV